ncbi:alpha/beta hydrolase [Streptomyces sp. NPDC087658]|uniref:alpha/beta hydrolase n=1 Tax=Streptomyces sp. NPDC087658 TaxID=3365800 RepID=UPI0037FDD01C
MPENFTRLLTQDFSDLDAAVSSWKKLAETLGRTRTESDTRVTGPLRKAGWSGISADYGFEAMEATSIKLGTGRLDTQLISSTLDTLQTRMRSAQRELRDAVADAEEAGHRVRDDGWVEHRQVVDPEHHNDPEYETLQQRANAGLDGFRSRIESALHNASTASYRAGELLHQIDPFDLDKRYGEANARKDAALVADFAGITENDIPANGNPEHTAEWWAALAPDTQRVYLTAFPEQIGAADGLPTTVRDQANRSVLDMRLNDYALRENSLGHQERTHFRSLTHLKARLDRSALGPEQKRMYLLGLSTRGDGRAIVALGNPDTAKHTAVQVPGTDNELENYGGQIDRANKLQNAASGWNGAKGAKDISVIAWLGYDAPEINFSVTGTERAMDGAEDLRNFTHGLRAAHEGERGHLTVVAHSYGSTVTGAADAGGNGLGADDMVVLGSPGLTVDHASQLHSDARHLWVGAATDDPISNFTSGLTLGSDPKDSEFGAQRMYVDTSGHSGYWDDGSLSLENMGAVIAGQQPGTGATP